MVINCEVIKKNSNNYLVLLVISTKEKSPQETLQRLVFRCGATYEDFSFVEMTKMRKTM
jgi:hypothetical protein